MSRPLRIEYPDAWHHVMNRGRRAEVIFGDEHDDGAFTALLQETSGMWNIRIAAYCLMPNHYHLLVQTPGANLSKALRHLNGVYTQRYNRRHQYDGQLFRGRYESILMNTGGYLLQAACYIHRNPLRGGLTGRIDDDRWSSHKGYRSLARKWDWRYKDYILARLSKNRKDWLRSYRKWAPIEEEDEVGKIIRGKKWPVWLGSQSFIARIKATYGAQKIDRARSSSRAVCRIRVGMLRSYARPTGWRYRLSFSNRQ